MSRVVCANFAHTTLHVAIKWKTQETMTRFYNLDAIVSVGYRVNSSQATAFRIALDQMIEPDFDVELKILQDKQIKDP